MAQPAAAYVFDAFDMMPDPVAILAADGSLLRANRAFRAAFRHWIGPQRPPWGRVQPPALQNGERRFDAPAPDGRRFEWAERVMPDGARFIVARDVTRLASVAEDALRAKTTLFATLTHELRTPLHGILGMAGLLESAPLEPNARAYVDAITQSGEHLLDLITEILDYSRLEAGHLALEATPFDPEAVMQDVAELLSPKAYAKGLEIAVSVRGPMPDLVAGDDGRVRQILFNLAGNAVKFTETGGVLLEVAQRHGGRLRFSVRDTGPGIPPDKQALIFEEFAQADASVARRHGGAGLGLAIVKRLARAMGGDVGLTSRPGHGSNFWVDLPLPAIGERQRDGAEFKGVRVAIVSDSATLNHAIASTVCALGAEIIPVSEPADVVLIDWREGLDLLDLERMRAKRGAFVALIPQERRDAIAQCRDSGVAHYTLKPVRRRSLAERMRAVLDDAGPLSEPDSEARTLTGLRVLLAEDNPINALLARTLLARAGCQVSVVHDGEAAVMAAGAASFDLILLDIRMPKLDGVEASQRIRAGGGPSAKAPIVALTADGEGERARALGAGMDDFITKPMDASRLLAVAERFTGRGNLVTVGGK